MADVRRARGRGARGGGAPDLQEGKQGAGGAALRVLRRAGGGGEVEGGRLRLYGVCGGLGIRFTAEAVVCRLARHQVLSWRDVF